MVCSYTLDQYLLCLWYLDRIIYIVHERHNRHFWNDYLLIIHRQKENSEESTIAMILDQNSIENLKQRNPWRRILSSNGQNASIINLSSRDMLVTCLGLIPVTFLDRPLLNSSRVDRVSSMISFVERFPFSFSRVASSEEKSIEIFEFDRMIFAYHNRFFRRFHREFLERLKWEHFDEYHRLSMEESTCRRDFLFHTSRHLFRGLFSSFVQ